MRLVPRWRRITRALHGLGILDITGTDWVRITRRLTKAFTGDEINKWPWRLLADPSTITCIGAAEEVAGEIAVHMLALHQNGITEEPEYMIFAVKHDEQGLARLELPYVFVNDDVTASGVCFCCSFCYCYCCCCFINSL